MKTQTIFSKHGDRTLRSGLFLLLASLTLAAWSQADPARTINIVADKDSTFKVDGKANPTLTLKAGEPVHLHITAIKGRSASSDGNVHGIALLRAKDRKKVEGWVFELQPGEHDYNLVAPPAGEYVAICTVICSDQHLQMKMKVVVVK